MSMAFNAWKNKQMWRALQYKNSIAKLPPRVPRPIKRYVKKEIHKNIENKYFTTDLFTEFGAVNNVWQESNVCEPAQGDEVNNRQGRQIKIRSLEIKGVLTQGSNESLIDDAYNCMRIVIALWTGDDNAPLVGSSATINTPINKVLYTDGKLVRKYLDRYIALSVSSTEKGDGDGYAPKAYKFKYYKKFKTPITVNYGDSGITLPSKRLIVSMVSDSQAVVHPGFINGYILCTYEDA